MKKVLIIANLFHASPRIPGIAKYLSSLGWEPTILTVPISEDLRYRLEFPEGFLDKVRIIETPYRGDIFWLWRKIFKLLGFKINKSILNQLKKEGGIGSQKSFIDYIFKFYNTIFAYPDTEKNWKDPAIRVGSSLLEKEKFNAIISSSSPVTAHIVANELKDKYKIPWVADLRDLWTQNHNYPYFQLRKTIEEKLERKALLPADALITVSRPLAEDLKKIHNDKKIYTITNAFYPEELNYPPIPLTKKFTVTYAGTLYTGKQDPEEFFVSLKELISEKIINPKDVEVRFYCGEMPWIIKRIKEHKLDNLVKVHERTSRTEVFRRQNESQILLLIYWGDKREKGWQSLKIFGYLAARRPILVIGGCGKDVVEEMINRTKSGFYCKNNQEIKNFILKSYLEYKKNGEVSYQGNLDEINRYNYREKAKDFSEVLNKIIEKAEF